MASLHVTNPLTTHTFTDMNSPVLGSFVKFHFDSQLRGPGSLQSSASSTSGSDAPMHSALVLGSQIRLLPGPGRRCTLEIGCYPVLSLHRSSDPVFDMTNAVGYDKLVHIPLPSIADAPTPTSFGDPLTAGGYINDRACWIQAKLVTLTLSEGEKWKTFNPEVAFPIDGVSRLLEYEHNLIARFFPSTSEPPPSPSHCGFPGNQIDFTPDGESFDGDDGDNEPMYETVADFYRVFPQEQWNEQMRLSVQRDDARRSEMKNARVQEWMEGLADIS